MGIKYILFFYLILSTFSKNILNNIQVHGGNYGYSFIFILSGITNNPMIQSSNEKIKLVNREVEKESFCSIQINESPQNVIYSCFLDENLTGKVFIKKFQDNIFELQEDIPIEPLNLRMNNLESSNLEFDNNIWKYNIKGEINQEILLESITYMDIKVDESNELAGCLIISKNENIISLNCKINNIPQNSEQRIIIPKKTEKGTLIIVPELEQDQNNLIYKSINFINATNLFFNENNKWEFTINIENDELPIGAESIIDILFNGISSLATCISNSASNINCIPNNEKQTHLDLVQIHYLKSENSTITWNNLYDIYEIPIQKKLKYKRGFDLDFISNIWVFKIEIVDKILPEDALVQIDINYDGNQGLANCYHSNFILNCQNNFQKQYSYKLLKISYKKTHGSISWENIKDEDIHIPLNIELTFKKAYDLSFIDNHWNFTLCATSKTIPKNSLITINIRYEENKICLARCYAEKDSYYNCTVDYQNQNKNDLLLLSKENEGVSAKWKTQFTDDEPIILMADLNLVKAYDLIYDNSNKKWNFKLEVEEELPKGSKLLAEVYYGQNTDLAECIYTNKILSCIRQKNNDLLRTTRLKITKTTGSITWLNIKENEVKIVSVLTLKFNKAYGLIFLNNWNFLIESVAIERVPYNSFTLIDILHNSNETIAKCDINGGSPGQILKMTCFSDNDIQSSTDIIKMNPARKYGSLSWSPELSSLNNNIEYAILNSTTLKFIDAYSMQYLNNRWIFTIFCKLTENIIAGDKYIIDIKYISTKGQFSSTASCFTSGGNKNQNVYFFCSCDYDQQTENDLIKIKYPKTEQATITLTDGISDNYQIILNTSLTLVKAYDLIFDPNIKNWKFKIDVKDGVLPPGAKVIIDAYIYSSYKTINCTSLNKNLIICDKDINSANNAIVKLTDRKTDKSSVEWKKNLQEDYLIYRTLELDFKEANNLFFNETNNKWSFQIEKISQDPVLKESKAITDILYNDLPSTASCFCNKILYCTADKEIQTRTDLIKISKSKSENSTITWLNLVNNEEITLTTGLNFLNVGRLKIGPNSYWIFDVFILNENIPNHSKVIIEILYHYYSCSLSCREGYILSLATCHINNKILNCETTLNVTLNDLVYLSTSKDDSKSSVTWNNLPENVKVRMYLELKLNYRSSGKLFKKENKYFFSIELLNQIPKDGYILIDILIDNRPSLSRCIATTDFFLECSILDNEIEKYINSSFIYITNKKTTNSTITWGNLEKNILINIIRLGFLATYDKEYIDNSNSFKFKILTYDNKLPNNISTSVTLKYQRYNIEQTEYWIVGCVTKNDVLFCQFNPYHKYDYFQLYLSSNMDYDDIIWSNGNNQYADISYGSVSLTFERIISFIYNKEKQIFEFSIKIGEKINTISFVIIDILVGDLNTYSYCDINELILECKTKCLNYTEDKIMISIEKDLGNIKWKNLDKNKVINNLLFIEAFQIYDLFFDKDKWKFKIKSKNEQLTFKEKKTLDILISGEYGLAKCDIENGLLFCEVDSENQNKSQLIELNKAYEGDIQLINIKHTYIPMRIDLELIKAYNLEYFYDQREWSFDVECILDENQNIIPKNSIFTVDIKYDNITNEMAYCSLKEELVNNKVILLCIPQNKISEDSLIYLNNIKSEYSSIIWKQAISEEKMYIYLRLSLDVKEANELIFNTNDNKWSFKLFFYYYSSIYIPTNSKILIDLIYNDQDSIGTCLFENKNYNYNYFFTCYPNIETQNKNDFVEISPIKKYGTVIFINSEKKLSFIYHAKLKFEKAYDLIFDKKWEFKIKVSESDLPNKRATIIDIIEDGVSTTAICVMNNYILLCEPLYIGQKISHSLYLKYNKESNYVEWTNLKDYEPIYFIYEINFINSYGGFYRNKWKFNLKYNDPYERTEKFTYKNVLLDILVNNEESTASCEIEIYSFLKCVSNHANQNKYDIIKIIGNKEPKLGTVYFYKYLSDEKKAINPVKLSIEDFYIKSHKNRNIVYFDIKGNLAYSLNSEIEKETITEMEVIIIKKDKKEIKSRAPCSTDRIYPEKGSSLYLVCIVDEEVLDNEKVKVNYDYNGNSKFVQFKIKNYQNIWIDYFNSDNWEENGQSDNNNDDDEKTDDNSDEDDNTDNNTDNNSDNDDYNNYSKISYINYYIMVILLIL